MNLAVRCHHKSAKPNQNSHSFLLHSNSFYTYFFVMIPAHKVPQRQPCIHIISPIHAPWASQANLFYITAIQSTETEHLNAIRYFIIISLKHISAIHSTFIT